MINYGVWLLAGKDRAYPFGAWCTGSDEFYQENLLYFQTFDINFAYRFREYMQTRHFHSVGPNAYEVREYR